MIGFVDIHSHIIPDVDDGPGSIEQTLSMIKMAYCDGIRKIIATPHYVDGVYDLSPVEIERKIKIIQEVISAGFPDMKIYHGREILYSQDTIEEIKKKNIETLVGTKYVLIEFNIYEEYNNIVKGIQTLLFAGYFPIVAHVERYYDLSEDTEKIKHLVEMGACIQVNALSISGGSGRRLKKSVKNLLKNRMVHFVASDAHNDKDRKPKLEKSYKIVSKICDEEYATELFIINPEKILKR